MLKSRNKSLSAGYGASALSFCETTVKPKSSSSSRTTICLLFFCQQQQNDRQDGDSSLFAVAVGVGDCADVVRNIRRYSSKREMRNGLRTKIQPSKCPCHFSLDHVICIVHRRHFCCFPC